MNEYDVKAPYGNYQTKGEEDPYSILMKMSSWNKEIRSTISNVTESLGGTIEQQSQILQSIEAIEINVMDIVTTSDATVARIGELEVTSSQITLTVAELDTRIGEAEGSITVIAGQVALKANSAIVTALGTRVNEAEISINGLNSTITSKVSTTDYNGVTLMSLIEQAPSYLTFAASRLNLVGAVTVLSDITGNLGTITAGDINLSNSIYVGAGVYLRGGGNTTGLYLDQAQVDARDGNMSIYALRNISIGPFSSFHGQVNLTSANVTWGNNKPVAVWG